MKIIDFNKYIRPDLLIFYVLTFDFIPSFTRQKKKKKNRRPVVFPVLGTLRTTCARVVNPRFYFFHLPVCYALPGSDGLKKDDRDLSSTSVICLPRHLFFKPTADKWLDANC
jgi:hypothetical protein